MRGSSEELRIIIFIFFIRIFLLLYFVLFLGVYRKTGVLKQIRFAGSLLLFAFFLKNKESLHSLNFLDATDYEISLLVIAINFNIKQ
jgi:hypothetical protein